MINAMSGSSTIGALTIHPLHIKRAIVWGGLVAGVLDAMDAVVAFGTQGLSPVQILQHIASGLLGKASFEGGIATAMLGCALHFLIAFVAAAVYVFAALWIPVLKEHVITFGLLYGVAVYFFMNYLVLPLSAVGPSPFKLGLFLNGVIGHALFVGLPIAWFARRTA